MYKKLLLSVLALFLFPALAGASLNDGLFAYYKFDNSLNDSTSNNNYLNGRNVSYGARFGGASSTNPIPFWLNCNGVDVNLTMVNKTQIDLFYGNFTISSWVNKQATSGGGSWFSMFGANAPQSWLRINAQDDGTALFGFTSGLDLNSGTGALPQSTWVHYVSRFNNSDGNMTINLNESSQYQRLGVGGLTIDDEITLCYEKRFGGYWKGYLSDLAIWNRTLTDTELVLLYHDRVLLSYPFPEIQALVFGNYTTSNGANYTRRLQWNATINATQLTSPTIEIIIEGATVNTTSITSGLVVIGGSYKRTTEGNYSFQLRLNDSTTTIDTIGSPTDFIQDLYRPSITANFTALQGFFQTQTNVSLQCKDSVFPNITYNMTLNNISLFSGNVSNGTVKMNTTNIVNGINNLTVSCADPFSSRNMTVQQAFYQTNISLIDEITYGAFDPQNITEVRLYFDDNSSYFDFKANTSSSVIVSWSGTGQLRLELTYLNGDVIPRYIDLAILGGADPVLICANKEGTQHYQQIIISASTKSVLLKNIYAKCYVAADQTRFAYQELLSLPAYTIAQEYSLITFDSDGNEVMLAGIDGSIPSTPNLDTIAFARKELTTNILGQSISLHKCADDGTETGCPKNSTRIYYDNLQQDNTAVQITIVRLKDNSVVYSEDTFINPNKFTVYFDVSALSNVTLNEVFRVDVDGTTEGGSNNVRRYFDLSGSTGVMDSRVAFIISLLFMIFGLTFTAARTTFSWLGILVVIISLGFTAIAVHTPALLMLQGMIAVAGLWISILLWNQNFQQVT